MDTGNRTVKEKKKNANHARKINRIMILIIGALFILLAFVLLFGGSVLGLNVSFMENLPYIFIVMVMFLALFMIKYKDR